jgi:hypothetical protein
MSGGKGALGTLLAVAVLAAAALLVPPGASAAGSGETATQVVITGRNITMEVSKSGPAMVFFSPGHRDQSFRFEYTRLFTFNDTGDGSYSPDELSYFCNLSGAVWQVSVQTRETAEAGKEITVTLTALLDLTEKPKGSSPGGRSLPETGGGSPGGRGAGGPENAGGNGTGDQNTTGGNGTGDQNATGGNGTGSQNATGGNGTGGQNTTGGNGTGGQNATGGNGTGGPGTPNIIRNAFTMTLTLTFYERDTYYDWGERLLLRGGSELKIRVQLRPGAPVPGTHLALEQSLGTPAESDREPLFRLYDSTGPKSARGSENEQKGGKEVIHTFQNTAAQQQRLAYTNATGAEQGYFTWTRTVQATTPGGVSSDGIGTSYRTDGVSLMLYGSVPNRGNATLYDFDPTIGIIPEAFPPVLQELVDRVLAHRQSSVLGIIIGLAAGAALIVARGATVRRKDRLDTVRLEKNPYYRAR